MTNSIAALLAPSFFLFSLDLFPPIMGFMHPHPNFELVYLFIPVLPCAFAWQLPSCSSLLPRI